MISPFTRKAALALGALTLAGCNDTPTEPGTTAAPPAATAFATAASNSWIRKADMPGGVRIAVTTAAVPNASGQSILYVMGGRVPEGGSLSRVQAYNVTTNTWTYRKQMPSPLYSTNGAGVIAGKIYVSGGRQQMDNKDSRPYLYVYDPAINTWTRKADMPGYSASAEGMTGVIDNQLYVLTCGEQEFCTYGVRLAVYRYNPATDQWTTVATSPFDSGPPVGATINRKLYFVSRQSLQWTTQLTVYDPATNTWTTKAPPPKPRHGGAAVALGAKLYLIGGVEEQSDGSVRQVRTVRVYDPASNSWSTRAALPEMRSGFSASKVSLGGKARIEVVGGPAPGNNLQYVP